MIPDELPIPPELAYDDAPPLSDWDLERMEDEALALADAAAMDPEAALGQLLDAASDGDPEDDAAPYRWRIADDGAAEWAMRHVAEIDQELEELATRAKGWTERIQGWFDKAARRLKVRRAYFDGHLTDYARRERDRTDGKRKTIELPSGKVRSTSSKPKATVVTEDAVIRWAKAKLDGDLLDAVVKVVESVRVSELREHVVVGHVVVAIEFGANLSCGCVIGPHEVQVETPSPMMTTDEQLALAPWALGELLDCDHGPGGGHVEAVLPVLIAQPAVLDLDGQVVPGTAVAPGEVTVKVVPGA
jgi:phage host-nuclease inhibitor protein Gam